MGPLARCFGRRSCKGLFSCHAETAGGGGLHEPRRHVRQGLFQRRGVQPGGRDRFPNDSVFPGPARCFVVPCYGLIIYHAHDILSILYLAHDGQMGYNIAILGEVPTLLRLPLWR